MDFNSSVTLLNEDSESKSINKVKGMVINRNIYMDNRISNKTSSNNNTLMANHSLKESDSDNSSVT